MLRNRCWDEMACLFFQFYSLSSREYNAKKYVQDDTSGCCVDVM